MFTRSEDQLVVIDHRHEGMPGIAHGGYLGGVLSAALGGGAAEVRLRRPVPAGRPLTLDASPGAAELRDGETVLARGRPAELDLDVPLPASFAEAEAAAHHFHGFHAHPFPGCLVCGVERAAGDGLRIFPGPVAGRQLVAAPWVPDPGLAGEDGNVRPELLWAALDCIELWALISHMPPDTPDRVVTASLTARIEGAVVAGEPHVVIGWPMGPDGRGWLAGAAILGPDGEPRVIGRQATVSVAGWGVPLGRDLLAA